MASDKRGALIAGVLLVLVVAGGVVAYRILGSSRSTDDPGASDVPLEEREQTPLLADYDATVYTSSGDAKRLTEIAGGKPLVLNFWATWCPYCVQEMPDYQQLYHIYGDKVSFAFVDCNYSRGETDAKATAWLAENGFGDLPTYFDTDKDASTAFGAWSYPTTIVVDANGEIVSAAPGRIDRGRMDALLSSLVN